MYGFVPKPARPNEIKSYKGVEPIDIHAQRWAEYKDLPPKAGDQPNTVGYVFAKSDTLPDGVINHSNPTGFIPMEKVSSYGEFAILGGSAIDGQGNILLNRISGESLPTAMGTLQLGGAASAAGGACGSLCTVEAAASGAAATEGAGLVSAGVAAGALAGVVALLWPSSLGDSSLYTDDQLKSLKEGRTRVRLHVEQQADGTLKGYGYNTQKRRDWEMIPIVHFKAQGSNQVADFGDGVTLTWTPSVEPASAKGIPPLEGSPKAPQIWIYPPTEQADNIIVDPIYPPEYKDFILVFPADSGLRPLYIVLSARNEPGTVTGQGQDVNGTWLAGASSGLGSPVPTRIANQLRGQQFKDFRTFRAAFWTAVGNDPELLSQFNPSNQGKILNGKAPFAQRSEHNGENARYEIHHIENIQNGGAVYDVDNLTVVTPKRHVDIHREDRQ